MSPYFVLDKVMEPIEGQLFGGCCFYAHVPNQSNDGNIATKCFFFVRVVCIGVSLLLVVFQISKITKGMKTEREGNRTYMWQLVKCT
jgi:hypothetical protein